MKKILSHIDPILDHPIVVEAKRNNTFLGFHRTILDTAQRILRQGWSSTRASGVYVAHDPHFWSEKGSIVLLVTAKSLHINTTQIHQNNIKIGSDEQGRYDHIEFHLIHKDTTICDQRVHTNTQTFYEGAVYD